ncbi:CDGSH iron-sulfur domain-containing protein [Streptomyces sp. NPDC052225]|uniref:CDGSH iron-sulfur domain-containing protein n=1 Tax=Streptomyces sp. NPDC052225 TaxID=3154949 RepID=UPI00342E8A26
MTEPAQTPGRVVRVTENGPYEVAGGVPLTRQQIVADEAGDSVAWRETRTYETPEEPYYLCRCGHSGAKPFCDGTHQRIGFDGGEEPAARAPYLEQAGEEDGPELTLTDAERLCAFARFCDVQGSIWRQVQEPGTADAVTAEAGNCPSGRLVAWNLAVRAALEPSLPESIGVVDDPQEKVAGPLWVRGGVPVVAADGTPYEVRNRVTLCRCGASRNKPFCDGSHASIGFRDDS